jgi:Bacterial SH3 domain
MRHTALFLLSFSLLFQACGDKASTTTPSGSGTTAETTLPPEKEETPKPVSKARYAQGDKLYCYALSGLVLRDQPAQSGAKLASVPMFAPLDVIDIQPFTKAFQTKESCGLPIDGHWVQVRYKDKEGWIFDGYLLSFPPKVETSDIDYWTGLSKVTASDDKLPAEDGLVEYNAVTWANGVQYTHKGYEGGSDHITVLPRTLFNLGQAYLFAIAEDPQSDYREQWKCDCNVPEQRVECANKEGYGAISIQLDDAGNPVITENWAD